MATLVLSTVGSAIGGPIGSAIGGLIGRQVDQAVFGSGASEGPRLAELSVTTSSYGHAIPRRFGQMRVAGTIIWATDLKESSETQGGKGQPSRTTYSYSVSFAVSVSSTPVVRFGRIWADGELLRGANGDLKVGGTLRTYQGNGDEAADPLVAAESGGNAPAFRDCAYVVFEDLQLEEFGNRIPALTFEVFASGDNQVSLSDIVPGNLNVESGVVLDYARGFSDDGGSIANSLKAIDRVYPLTAISGADGIVIEAREGLPNSLGVLPEPMAALDDSGSKPQNRLRGKRPVRTPIALRYYDEERDYQPGVQRALGKRGHGNEQMIDLPAAMTADGAKQLINSKAHRERWLSERLDWLTSELNPQLLPGATVKLPDHSGYWFVAAWEWHEQGIEYTLHRAAPSLSEVSGAVSGTSANANDAVVTPTILKAIEVPHHAGTGGSSPALYAVANSTDPAWRGATLYVEQGSSLIPIGGTGRQQATAGTLASVMPPSDCLMLESNSSFEVQLPSASLAFQETDMVGLSAGANRILVGSEIVQFLRAEPLNDNRWQLSGILRGRGGTETSAASGHEAGTNVTLLDDRITPLDPASVPSVNGTRIAAIGIADAEPSFASLENAGLSLRPLTPVHPVATTFNDGSIGLSWTRRARGAWIWENGIETPLVEEHETYMVGFGPIETPYVTWETTIPSLLIANDLKSQLIDDHGASNFWVRQIGTHAASSAVLLTTLV